MSVQQVHKKALSIICHHVNMNSSHHEVSPYLLRSLKENCRRWNGKITRIRRPEKICCEIMALRNNREASSMISKQIWLPQRDLDKVNTNRHITVEGGLSQGSTPRQLRHTGNWRSSLPYEETSNGLFNAKLSTSISYMYRHYRRDSAGCICIYM